MAEKMDRMAPDIAIKVALKKLKIANKVSGDGKGLWHWKENQLSEKNGRPFIRKDIKLWQKCKIRKYLLSMDGIIFKGDLVSIFKLR